MDLKQRFFEVLGNWFKDDVKIESYWNELNINYKQKFRHYHNMNHLSEMFGYYDRYEHHLNNPKLVAFAIFYHDIVYSIWSKNNELDSARLAKHHLKESSLDDSYIAQIFDLILVTKDHQPKTNTDENWMIDFDLAILGQPWESYILYSQQIRKEYGIVPTVLYKNGRKKVLRHFLKKNNIYNTSVFLELYELQARTNLETELKTL